MSYATQSDMELAFGEVELVQATNQGHGDVDDETPDTINVAVLSAALANAAALIDSYIGACIDLPLPESPPALIQAHMDITRYLLNEDNPGEEVKDRYDRALKYITALCGSGPVLIDPDGAVIPPSDTGVDTQVFTRDRMFTDSLWATYLG